MSIKGFFIYAFIVAIISILAINLKAYYLYAILLLILFLTYKKFNIINCLLLIIISMFFSFYRKNEVNIQNNYIESNVTIKSATNTYLIVNDNKINYLIYKDKNDINTYYQGNTIYVKGSIQEIENDLELDVFEFKDYLKYKRVFYQIIVDEEIKIIDDKIPLNQKIINSLIDNECIVVPDPVFLLTKKQWISNLNLSLKNSKEYILFFELHVNSLMRDFTYKLSKKYGYKIIRVTNDFFKIKKMKSIKRTGPIDFLNLILNAKIVITDSFHAAAFALIFNKDLYIGLKDGKEAHLNTRIDSLASMYKIKNQIITRAMKESTIDYSYVNEKIEKERIRGIGVLKGIVNDTNI